MSEIRIKLDPCNPGQFYACCGLIELLELAGARTLSRFYADSCRPRDAEFVVRCEDGLSLDAVLKAIKNADFRSGKTDKPPYKDAIAPVSISIFGRKMELDWWLNEFHDQATPLKCWARDSASIPDLLGRRWILGIRPMSKTKRCGRTRQ
jgi:hypothetical protein